MEDKEKEIEENLEEEIEVDPTPDEEEEILVDPVLQQIEDLQQEVGTTLDGWQRTQAEFLNYKKRTQREQIRMREDASARVIRSFLGVLDDLDRAILNRPTDGEGADWAKGIDLVYRKMLATLESEGVKPMEAEGVQFDPNLHEAIMQEESKDHNSGEIIEVIQIGYFIGERVLRPAVVKVAS